MYGVSTRNKMFNYKNIRDKFGIKYVMNVWNKVWPLKILIYISEIIEILVLSVPLECTMSL